MEYQFTDGTLLGMEQRIYDYNEWEQYVKTTFTFDKVVHKYKDIFGVWCEDDYIEVMDLDLNSMTEYFLTYSPLFAQMTIDQFIKDMRKKGY